MATSTSIEWTETTWNPVRGCSRVSPGCENCYAERMVHRFSGTGRPYEGLTRSSSRGPRWTGKVALVQQLLGEPLRWRRPRLVFVNSMSDLFHEAVPDEFIQQVFATMGAAQQHTFQVLTKRADRLAALAPSLEWPVNVWMGVSVESNRYAWRADRLRATGAAIKFVSVEPLLGPIGDLELDGLDWVIVGGESGPGARHMHPDWVRDIRDRCEAASLAFFFKQWGGVRKKSTGRVLDGHVHDAMPVLHPGNHGKEPSVALRVRGHAQAERQL